MSLQALIKTLMLSVVVSFSSMSMANEVDVAINVVLETAKSHTPGKVVAYEKAEEYLGEEGAEILQPVYRVKILSEQGVMKTLFVHRQTGQVTK